MMVVFVRRRSSVFGGFLIALVALVPITALGNAYPVAVFVLMGLALLGILAFLFVPVYLHRRHDDFTDDCPLCRTKLRGLREAERKQLAAAARASDFERLQDQRNV